MWATTANGISKQAAPAEASAVWRQKVLAVDPRGRFLTFRIWVPA